MDRYLYHHGILKQKHGVRNGPPYPLSNEDRSPAERRENPISDSAREMKKNEPPRPKSINEMTDAELKALIDRKKLEQQYRDLCVSSEGEKKVSRGRKMVADILESSTRNVGTQATTYLMGKGVNKAFYRMFGEDIVNPKKGQKDK